MNRKMKDINKNNVEVMDMMKGIVKDFVKDESGMGVVEVILIIVVLIAMVVIFKKQITTLVNNIWDAINKSAGTIYG